MNEQQSIKETLVDILKENPRLYSAGMIMSLLNILEVNPSYNVVRYILEAYESALIQTRTLVETNGNPAPIVINTDNPNVRKLLKEFMKLENKDVTTKETKED